MNFCSLYPSTALADFQIGYNSRKIQIALSCGTLASLEKLRINLVRFAHIQERCKQIVACRPALGFALYVFNFLLTCACAAPVAAETSPQSFGKWQISLAPLAGEESLALSLKAEKAVKGWMKNSVPVLTIQCVKGKANVYVETGMALEVTVVDQQIVHLQLDDNKPFTQRWREITNATVSARDPTTLFKQLTKAKNFVFEFTPFSSPPVKAEFIVAGLSAYLPQLAKSCWKE